MVAEKKKKKRKHTYRPYMAICIVRPIGFAQGLCELHLGKPLVMFWHKLGTNVINI